jgi:hypothetical protein
MNIDFFLMYIFCCKIQIAMGHGHGQHGAEMRNYSSPYPARSMNRGDIAGVSNFFVFYFFFSFQLFINTLREVKYE